MDIPKYREPDDLSAAHRPTLSTFQGATLIAGLTVAYTLSYPFLNSSLGAGAGILVSVPAATAAWLFGARIGIAAAFLAFGLNSILETVVSGRDWLDWIQDGSGLGHLALLLSTGGIGLLRDLGARKEAELEARVRAENLLWASEERYRSIYENTPVMMHSMDREFRLVSVNNHWLETLDRRRDEVMGRDITEFLTESARKNTVEILWPHLIRAGVLTEAELQMVKRNGEVIDVLLSGITVMDEEGALSHTLAFLTDVTERKRAEEEIKRLALAVANIGDGVSIIDVDGRILFVNPALNRMLGYEQSELVGVPVSSLYPEGADDPVLAAIMQQLLSPNPPMDRDGRREDSGRG